MEEKKIRPHRMGRNPRQAPNIDPQTMKFKTEVGEYYKHPYWTELWLDEKRRIRMGKVKVWKIIEGRAYLTCEGWEKIGKTPIYVNPQHFHNLAMVHEQELKKPIADWDFVVDFTEKNVKGKAL